MSSTYDVEYTDAEQAKRQVMAVVAPNAPDSAVTSVKRYKADKE
jgi:hypothetical protein